MGIRLTTSIVSEYDLLIFLNMVGLDCHNLCFCPDKITKICTLPFIVIFFPVLYQNYFEGDRQATPHIYTSDKE